MPINQPTSKQPGLPSAPTDVGTSSNAPGNLADNPKTSSTDPDAISNLLELKYAGIPFPATNFTENGSQDTAVHKYPNLDTARVELTGRNPSTYSCKAVLTNNIYPSKKETWKAGQLFPRTFSLLLTALYNSTSFDTLQHPFLGDRNVVPTQWSYSFAGQGPRDGVYLDITWIETIGDAELASTVSVPNSLADMQTTAQSIDADMMNLGTITVSGPSTTREQLHKTQFNGLNPPNLTVGQMFSKFAGIVRSVASVPQNVIAPINAQIVQANASTQGAGAAIATSIPQLIQSGQAIVNQNKGLVLHGPVSNAYYYDRAALAAIFNYNQTALDNVYSRLGALNHNAHNNASQLLESLQALTVAMIQYYQTLNRVETAVVILHLYSFLSQIQRQLNNLNNNNRNYGIQTYTVQVPTTLVALSRVLNNTVDQLLQLNHRLNSLYHVPNGTLVNYYQG